MSIEILGTAASVVVLLSFVVTGEARIRAINIFGAVLFTIYGALLGAFSVWFLNGALLLIHCFYLYRGWKYGRKGEGRKR